MFAKKLRSWLFRQPASDEATVTNLHSTPLSSEIVAFAQSDIGKVRLVNEDRALFSRPASFRRLRSRGALALVADGMGGAQGGNIASEIAAQLIPNHYHASEDEPPEALRKAIAAANKSIYKRAHEDANLKGMGATCMVLVLSPTFAWAAWVGDSRLYLVRNKQIFKMSDDHSMVNEMVKRGMLTEDQAAVHEDRNVVTRALGSRAKVEPSIWEKPYPVHVGDRFLVCSDGIHDVLSASEILELLGEGSVTEAAGRLLIEANERGGYDNASVVVADIVDRSQAWSTRELADVPMQRT